MLVETVETFQLIPMYWQSEKDSKEEVMKAFRLFDDDGTGKISFKNLKRVAKELGENLTDEELQVRITKSNFASILDGPVCRAS